MTHRRTAAVALALGLAMVFVGLSQGKTLVVGIDSDALTLDPGNFRHRETETILRNMYDGLVTRTPGMEIVPELAVSWERVSDTGGCSTFATGSPGTMGPPSPPTTWCSPWSGR